MLYSNRSIRNTLSIFGLGVFLMESVFVMIFGTTHQSLHGLSRENRSGVFLIKRVFLKCVFLIERILYRTVVLRLLSFGNFIVKLLFFIARDQKGAGVTKTRYSNIPLSDGREIICEKYTYSILVHIRHASVLSPGPYVCKMQYA